MRVQRTHPLSYEAAARAAGVSGQIPLGTRPIRVRRIVGSAGKAEKLGPDFRPIAPGPAQAGFRAVYRKMQQGEDLPPITVYQVGSRYFVIDGHTRVAAAKALGIEFIDAEVIECLPRKEGEINLTYYARKEFERYTGLEGIRLTSPWRYHILHHHIEGYRLYLEKSWDRSVSLPEAARIWHRTQYVPTLLEIGKRRLRSKTGGRTSGDVYTDILKVWAEHQTQAISLREMLDHYDQDVRSEQRTLERARRVVSGVVNATLPKAMPPFGAPDRDEMAQADVDAELQALEHRLEPEDGP